MRVISFYFLKVHKVLVNIICYQYEDYITYFCIFNKALTMKLFSLLLFVFKFTTGKISDITLTK